MLFEEPYLFLEFLDKNMLALVVFNSLVNFFVRKTMIGKNECCLFGQKTGGLMLLEKIKGLEQEFFQNVEPFDDPCL